MSTELPTEIVELIKSYPKFDDGRIDYTHARICPVVNCVVKCGDEVLLTERGADVLAYPNTIDGIAGFIGEIKPLEEVVYQELREEVGLLREAVLELRMLPEVVKIDEEINREWHVFAAVAVVGAKFTPVINWENKRAIWTTIGEAKRMKLVPGFRETLGAAE